MERLPLFYQKILDSPISQVLGIDPGLTEAGWCVLKDGEIITGTMGYTIAKGGELDKMTRLLTIANEIWNVVERYDIRWVGIEGYAFRQHGSLPQLGELVGIIKHMLWTGRQQVCYMVPVSAARAFVLGKGIQKKPEVTRLLEQAGRKFSTTHEQDAWIIARTVAGCVQLDIEAEAAAMTPMQIKALEGIHRMTHRQGKVKKADKERWGLD